MLDVAAIVSGWMGVIGGGTKTRDRAGKRLLICAQCPSLQHKEILKYVLGKEKKESTWVCGECGCPLLAKARAKKNTCPLKSWHQ